MPKHNNEPPRGSHSLLWTPKLLEVKSLDIEIALSETEARGGDGRVADGEHNGLALYGTNVTYKVVVGCTTVHHVHDRRCGGGSS